MTTPSNGTKTYNYNNSKITKREIASKDVGNSSLVIEYKIVVTNERTSRRICEKRLLTTTYQKILNLAVN